MKFILLLLCMFLVTHRISSMTVKQFNATRNWCGILVKISRKLRVMLCKTAILTKKKCFVLYPLYFEHLQPVKQRSDIRLGRRHKSTERKRT
ncbi:unnamed protein product [Callosobruchus maculatus]|uniref:Secreted protein n=1 Tax=Callosobruchus maculatus TaxID=64391 RepID=A0A653CWH2_CALMS|nr:unnamed protein product [Callosobruchus maculatus]